MKIYIKGSETIFDDFEISYIYIVSDARTATLENSYISADSKDDSWYERYDDDELLGISYNAIKLIKSEVVLDRIHELYLQGKYDKQPLSVSQQHRLSKWYRMGNPEIKSTDIEVLLKKIQSAVSVNLPFDRTEPDEKWKNYAKSKGLNLNMEDYLGMLKQLKSYHFRRELKSGNVLHLGNRLLEFILSGTFTTHDGTNLSNVHIYIKIEKNISDGNIILISFHEPEFEG